MIPTISNRNIKISGWWKTLNRRRLAVRLALTRHCSCESREDIFETLKVDVYMYQRLETPPPTTAGNESTLELMVSSPPANISSDLIVQIDREKNVSWFKKGKGREVSPGDHTNNYNSGSSKTKKEALLSPAETNNNSNPQSSKTGFEARLWKKVRTHFREVKWSKIASIIFAKRRILLQPRREHLYADTQILRRSRFRRSVLILSG